MIDAGACVIVHLSGPREQVFGVVVSLTPAGIVVRGLPLSGVDDWMRELGAGGAPSTGLGLSTCFYPMHRVDKVVLDEESWGVPSVQERFFERIGRSVVDHLAGDLVRLLPGQSRRPPSPSRRPSRRRPRA